MVTHEQHEQFIRQLDEVILSFKGVCKAIDDTNGLVEHAITRFCKIRFGKELPIKWVKPGDSVNEFYPSEHTIHWLVAYVGYFNKFLSDKQDLELSDIKQSCLFLGIALSKVRGINIIDDTVYLLSNDLEFVNYKLKKQIFI